MKISIILQGPVPKKYEVDLILFMFNYRIVEHVPWFLVLSHLDLASFNAQKEIIQARLCRIVINKNIRTLVNKIPSAASVFQPIPFTPRHMLSWNRWNNSELKYYNKSNLR